VNQRSAIASQFGWDIADVEEYQHTRRVHNRVFVYQTGSGYAVALKEGQKVPLAITNGFGAFTPCRPFKGWTVWVCDTRSQRTDS